MLFKTAFIGISAIAAVFILSSYQTDGQKIIWDKNYKLKWEDYKSPPDSQRPDIKAGSSVGHGYTYRTKGDSVFITIESYFFKSESWVDSGSINNNLLLHEQGHFDIEEIYARLLRKNIAATNFFKQTFEKQLQGLHNKSINECNKEQDLIYDKETDLSRNLAKQKQWNMKIAKRLKELEAYSNTTIKVKLW